jgi:hypothetical protein
MHEHSCQVEDAVSMLDRAVWEEYRVCFCYVRGSQVSVVCRASCGESVVMLAAVSNGAVCTLLSEVCASLCKECINSSVENGGCKGMCSHNTTDGEQSYRI